MAATRTNPTIPPEAAEAALIAFERGRGYSNRERVRWAVVAALPGLMPGMYVTHDPADGPVIWMENPDRPTWPQTLLERTESNALMFDALARILPERTDDDL